MQVTETVLPGVLIIQARTFDDTRGRFWEAYSRERYTAWGIGPEFVQDNCSVSTQGAIRGLHYQIGRSQQGKLGCALAGTVLDVAVDIRVGSPTFGRHVAVELTAGDGLQLWVPPGFAHGISVLSETAVFFYKCTAYYSAADSRAILFSDEELGIDWRVPQPLASPADLAAPRFRDIEPAFHYPNPLP